MRRSKLYRPKEALIQFPSLWLPGAPLPSSRGMPGYPCCCEQPCSDWCEDCAKYHPGPPIDSGMPVEVEVTLSGIVESVAGCDDDCTDLNTSFILSSDVQSGQCQWKYDLDPIISCDPDGPPVFQGYNTIWAIYADDWVIPEVGVGLDVSIESEFGFRAFFFQGYGAELQNCCTWDEENVPFSSQSSTNFMGCDFSGATATVTSL